MRKLFFSFLFSFVTLLFLFSLSARVVSFSFFFYEREFQKYDTYASFPDMTKEQIHAETTNLIVYLKGGGTILDPTFFSERERLHLHDVRYFYYITTLTFIFSLLILFFLGWYSLNSNRLGILLQQASIAAFAVVLSAILFVSWDFTSFFTWFHTISFTNDFWLLDSSTSLIKLFPEDFFYDMVLYIFSGVVLAALLLFFVGFWYHRATKNKKYI